MKIISSLVKGVYIKLTPKSLGRIFSIPYHNLSLNDIDMDDEEVLSHVFLPDQGSPMTNTKLQPVSRLIGRILAYNICSKIESYNYFSRDLATCVYAIMAVLEVNWVKIIFDNIVKKTYFFLTLWSFSVPCVLKI